MSLNLPSRRLIQAVARPAVRTTPTLLPLTQRRTKWFDFLRRKNEPSMPGSSPAPAPFVDEATREESRRALMHRGFGRRSGATIFEEEASSAAAQERGDSTSPQLGASQAKEAKARALDPDPRSRVRWQRKKVIQMVKANGFMSKQERIRRNEKEVTSKSEFLPTSTKKIGFLARQVVGKSVEDAIVQMRYSKKKMAQEVKYQLEEARDLAIASRGMGLGKVNGEIFEQGHEKKIKTKDGKWLDVADPTRLYVDQAWVNKGPWRGFRPMYHGRGYRSTMKKPTASVTLVLKEERTRIRQHDDREAKQRSKAPWVQLPNRPITGQRQHYSW